MAMNLYRSFGKRVFDLLTAAALLALLSPLFIAIFLMIALQNRGRAFFYQQRPGRHEQPFYIIKFKTMNDARDSNGELLPDMQRITGVGHWIRKLSLDELPQLINVLKGDMSIVGPRPLLFSYIPLYSPEQRRRHEVRPGITGWAQVNGRNAISWEMKFTYDLYYIKHQSFRMDLKIMWLTLLKVLKREGINQSDARPMQPFQGN